VEDDVENERKKLRAALLSRRRALHDETRRRLSARIVRCACAAEEFQRARSVMVYVAVKGEVETRGLIEECFKRGKRVAVPWCDPRSEKIKAAEINERENELVEQAYGIPAPPEDRLHLIAPTEIDLIVVPGVGFDWTGVRLGWGMGYYDDFLAAESPRSVKLALSYEVQLVPRITPRSHDVLMDKIITDVCVIDCRRIRNKILYHRDKKLQRWDNQ
jgi:5-formyltetrahydrofolate cyclo-ligase